MGMIQNDDRSDETLRREERAINQVRLERPDLSFDAAVDLALERMREHRKDLARRRDERRANTLFGDIRKLTTDH